MRISVDHMTGFAVGIGVATMGFYVYKKNQSRVDGWLRQQGINVPMAACTDPAVLELTRRNPKPISLTLYKCSCFYDRK